MSNIEQFKTAVIAAGAEVTMIVTRTWEVDHSALVALESTVGANRTVARKRLVNPQIKVTHNSLIDPPCIVTHGGHLVDR
jgi:hypothetical protein